MLLKRVVRLWTKAMIIRIILMLLGVLCVIKLASGRAIRCSRCCRVRDVTDRGVEAHSSLTICTTTKSKEIVYLLFLSRLRSIEGVS